ncbi:MAG: UDP-4-amino-4-deoxy-L-arabinose-oxoglutarate aminotransferase [Verrucomicrobia bacterium]|nr:UDP-4-amino-4-deoxy-L-arabinose-oxoglutarate aminotransferase [Verrucomicrobiota bacterium]
MPTEWPQLAGRAVTGTYRGRTAIALACELLGISSGDEVLMPAYNCGTEIDAVQSTGAKAVLYRITSRAQLDLEDLMARRTEKTKAVYVIHYFGWEQSMARIRLWCDKSKIQLIEDCALSLLSEGETSAIGRIGDAAIYSLPKTLGFTHGGLLALPSAKATTLPKLRPAGFSQLKREVRNSAKTTAMGMMDAGRLYGSALALRRLSRRGSSKSAPVPGPGAARELMPADYAFDPATDANRGIHSAVLEVSAALPWQEIIKRRRANYTRLAKRTERLLELTPLFPNLGEGVCPLSFPFVVRNRDQWVARLQAQGIAALPWWKGYHGDTLGWEKFPEACHLKDAVMTLPIGHNLDESQVDYIADCLTASS